MRQGDPLSTEPTFFASPAAWREWLDKHHETASECLVGLVKVTTGAANMTWSESVDQALCFGWIDGVRRRIDDRSYSIRFTPRKPASIWSRINVEKVTALEAAGLMAPAGRQAFAGRSAGKTAIYSYERDAEDFSDEQAAEFGSNQPAWTFWLAQAPWYRRNATHWVLGAKRAETRERRLKQLIEDSAHGRRLRHLRGEGRQ
jgi:uncharacterized protein YdeI (YjbR/CyaY-like superfamily)